MNLSRNIPRIDPRAERARRQSAWVGGDYAVLGNALQIVAEDLCETLDLRPEARVLDVAVGHGHAGLAAARRWCDVTSTDLAPDLANRALQRAQAENLGVRFLEAEAEALPFADQSFEAVVSAFGAMFSPDAERAASEMVRVCRRGGRVGITSWTPEGFIGQLFALIDRHQPAASVGAAPLRWGVEEKLMDWFGVYGAVELTRRSVVFRSPTAADWVEKFRAGYVPLRKMFSGLGASEQRSLSGELRELAVRFNRSKSRSLVVDAEYLEVVVLRH